LSLSVFGKYMVSETTVKPARKVELYDETSPIVETAKGHTIYITLWGDDRKKAVDFIGHSTGTEPNAERELVELEFWTKDGAPLVTMQAPDGESFTVPVDRDALEFHQEYFENEVAPVFG
jgi:hypothetical protein